MARASGGTFLLRIEDTDSTRCRPEWTLDILDVLGWLGMNWDAPPRHQSRHLKDYAAALDDLATRGLLYPCSCTRRAIADAGARTGAEGLVYPGTCRRRGMDDARPGDALRLNLGAAIAAARPLPAFDETGPLHPGRHPVDPAHLTLSLGDPVLRRIGTEDPAYHLACPHDDAAADVSLVVRGADLWHATPLHALLQTLMGWRVPAYHHHDLIRDEDGRRLSKVDRSRAIARYRAEGATPTDVRRMVGLAAA